MHPSVRKILISTGIVALASGCGGGGGSSPSGGGAPANVAPTWTSTAPALAKEGHTYSYVMAGQDANADSLTFSLVQGPAGASASGNSVTWVPSAAQVGSAQAFKARVSDGKGATADQDWTVTPSPNAVPAFTTTASTSAKEGHAYVYSAGVADADGDTVAITVISQPSGAIYRFGVFTWSPTAAQVGVPQAFTLRADDGFGGQKEQTWTVTPSANSVPAFTTTPSSSAREGHAYAYTPGTSDGDADTVTISVVSLPSGAIFSGGVIAWIPSAAQVGTPQTFVLWAVDGFGGQKDQTWTVTPSANSAPAFTTTPPSSAKEGHAYAYTAGGSDADGDAVTIASIALPTGATFTGGAIAWSPSAAQVGVAQTFTLRATDGIGGQKDQTWIVTPAADTAPTFLTTAATTGMVGAAYSYLAGTFDAEGDTVTYTFTAKPAWASLTGNTVAGTPSTPGPAGFTLRASDGIKTTDQSWTVSVAPAGNRAPSITSAPLTSATGGQPYTYFLTATDADGDSISYQLQSGPTGAALNGNALTWTPSSSQERTASNFTVVAVDVWGAASTPHSWSITPTGTIQGSSVLTYLPLDWSTVTITPTPVPNPGSPQVRAIAPDGAGGYTTLMGYYNATDGNFAINGVPGGKYWLTYNNFDYIWTDKAQVDLGWTVSGRKDQVSATISPTNVVFDMTGMNAWNDSDYLQFFDFNSNNYQNPNYEALSGWPVAGNTNLTGLTMDWASSSFRHLVDTTKGDAPQVVQMVTQTSGIDTYQVAKKRYVPASLTMVNGSGTNIAGAFSDIPLTAIFTLNWKGSAFAQYAGATTLNGTPYYAELYLIGTPGRSAYGNANSLDLLYYFQGGTALDVNLGALPVPEVPSGVDLSCVAAGVARRNYQLPGTTVSKGVNGFVWLETATLPTANAPLQPLVSPVQNPTISGQSLLNDVSGVGITPTLSWNPPALGSPTGYIVNLTRLWTGGTTTTYATTMAKFYTTSTSLTLPPNLMNPGEAYYFTIKAFASPGWDLTTAPYRFSKATTYGYADCFSGIIRP